MLYDKDIREPLFDFLEEQYGKIRIIEEKRMGKSRADLIMVIPGAIVGMEIKSDADSYARLGRQVKDYDQFFDLNYVAIGSSHAMHIEEHIPEWWGIITIDELETGADFYILRRPKPNPKMDWKKKMSLLWRPELVHIQELNQLPRYERKSKLFVVEKIIEKVPQNLLLELISEELFERDYNSIEDTIREYKISKRNAKSQAGVVKKAARRRKRRLSKSGV